MKKSNNILIVFTIILMAFLIPTWLCSNKISSIKEGIYCTDADSLFYHRIIDQAYEKGNEKFIDYDNYGNFPHLFKIGYPRFYFWTLLFVKRLCSNISSEYADILFNFFPIITTTITALIILICLWFMKYPPIFLMFTAFFLIPTLPAMLVGNFGKLDYDHILSLYIWCWLLCAMFYQDTEDRKWLYIGGLFAGLLFGSWLGSLMIFFVVSIVCFILWIFKSSVCKKYLPYCCTTFAIAAAINTIVVILSPTRYGFELLDFGIIHLLAIWLATAGIYVLTKVDNNTKNISIALLTIVVTIIAFISINIDKSKDLLDKVFSKDPIFAEISELQPLLKISKLFINAQSVEKIVSNYGILFFLFPLFIFIPVKKIVNRESAVLLKLWLIIPTLASLYQNRYARILGIGCPIYAAFLLYLLWQNLKGYFEDAAPHNSDRHCETTSLTSLRAYEVCVVTWQSSNQNRHCEPPKEACQSSNKSRHCEPLKEAWQSSNKNCHCEPLEEAWQSSNTPVLYNKYSKLAFYSVFTLLLLFIRASFCWGVLNYSNPIRKSELEAFNWIKNNTPKTSGYSDNKEPEYGILAYWDFGNFINFYAHRPVIANNMQNGVKHMADIFSSKNEEEAYKLCESLKIKYVFITPDRILFPQTIDFWPEFKKQESGIGYKSLPPNFERSKDYDRWFFTWLTKDFSLRPRGDFKTSSNFRIIFASYENNPRLYSTLLFERVKGAKLYLEAKENSIANVNLKFKVGNSFLRYYKELKVNNNGVVCFNLPYSCAFNNKTVFTEKFYDISFISKETNKRVLGKVFVKEEDVISGNHVGKTSIHLSHTTYH